MTTNRKRHLKSEFALFQTSSIPFNFISFGKCWRNFLRLNLKGPYLSVEKEKDNFCVVFTYSIKRACEIWNFHVAGVQRRQRNDQISMMHVQICCVVNKNLLLFCRSFSSPLSLVLLSYRNSATMVTRRHTSPLSCSPVGDVKCKFFSTDASTNHTIPVPN